MMKIKNIAIASAMLASAVCTSNAQDCNVPQNDDFLRKAETLVIDKKFQAAEIELEKNIKSITDKGHMEKAEYLILCSRFRQNKLTNSEATDFLEKYPYTQHKNQLLFILGYNYYRLNNYKKSAKYFKDCQLFELSQEDCELGLYASAVVFQKDNPKDAIVNYYTLKEMNSRFSEDATYNLGYTYYQLGDFKHAKQEFAELNSNSRFYVQAKRYMADIYYQEKEYQKAINTTDNLLKTYGNDIDDIKEIYRIKGQSLYMTNRYNDAIPYLERYVKEADKPNREALYMLAMSYFETKGYTKATEYFGMVTDVNDKLAQNAYLHSGIAQLEMKNTDKARLAFAHASSTDFDKQITLQALYNYALTIHETSYSPFNESVTVFERLLNEYPNSQYTNKTSQYLADAYLATTSYEASLESINKIKNPTSKILEAKQIILFRLGTEQFANGQYEDAIESFSNSLSYGKYNLKTKKDAIYWRGEAFYRLKDYNKAQKDFATYAELENDRNAETYAMSYYNLGYIFFKEKAYAKALNSFQRCESQGKSISNIVKADMYNRIGDCFYRNRNFSQAEKYYNLAAATDPAQGDYAMFQSSFILGLQKNYMGKIAQIDKMIAAYPNSVYCDDATFEKGRAYVMSDDKINAIKSYNELLAKYPSSQYVRRAESEIALLYYQCKEYAKAEEAYKNVIAKYPGTEEAGQAQRDLRSMFIDLNKVDEYIAYMSSSNNGTGLQTSEKDSLTYMAAEKLYMNNELAKGATAMDKYLSEFPDGAFNINANYYVGLYNYNENKRQNAAKYLENVAANESSQFTEEALVMLSDIYYGDGEYAKAKEKYAKLKEKASFEERIISAECGMMRCADKLGESTEVIEAANALLQHSKTDPQLIIEAHYMNAKAYSNLGKQAEAFKEWSAIADDTRNSYGAEAKFRVAEYYFNAGNDEKAEKEIFDYIDKGTPHAYWMARSFILQSDIYKKQGKNIDARQFLLSLKQNYSDSEEINEMIETRLNDLKN